MTEKQPSPWPEISNQDLKASDVPSPDASWDQIKRFAGSFSEFADADRYEKLANQARKRYLSGEKLNLDDLGLSDLRAILFLHWRALRHGYCGGEPSAPEMKYMMELIGTIRRKVVSNLG
jgi:hypothetical protein